MPNSQLKGESIATAEPTTQKSWKTMLDEPFKKIYILELELLYSRSSNTFFELVFLVKPNSTQPNLAQPNPTKPNSTQPISTQLNLTQHIPTQPNLSQPNSTQPTSTQINSTQISPTQLNPTLPIPTQLKWYFEKVAGKISGTSLVI